MSNLILTRPDLLIHSPEVSQLTIKLTGKCFSKCVDVPGKELSAKEQDCIWNCTQRMWDSQDFLTKRTVEAAKQLQQQGRM